MLGLFQTTARPGPVSDAVARIWRTNAAPAGTKTASFFPREATPAEPVVTAEASPALEAPAKPLAGMPANAPLPPPRPQIESFAALQLQAGSPPTRAVLNLFTSPKSQP
jgi:hypothetical protein